MYKAVARVCELLSKARPLVRLPIIPASLAALLLVLSGALLLFGFFEQSNHVRKQQSSLDIASTVDRLSTVVNAESTEWVQSDKLAQLVASADVQVARLAELSDGSYTFNNPHDSVREVGADWTLVREALLALNNAGRDQNNKAAPDLVLESPVKTESLKVASAPARKKLVQPEITELAQAFKTIQTSVTEGTRDQLLLDLVNVAASDWQPVLSGQVESVETTVAQQKKHAETLLRLSGAGTDNSLFGYYTANSIVDYAQRVKAISLAADVALPESVPLESDPPESDPSASDPSESTPSEPAPLMEAPVEDSGSLNTAFISEALASLEQSIAKLVSTTAGESVVRNSVNWFALAGLVASLLLLLSAITKMAKAAGVLKAYPDESSSSPHLEKLGAMSMRDADELIEDINKVADGDLRHSVRVQGRGHAKAIAESVNRSGAVIRELVEMARTVAMRLKGLVQTQEQHSRVLAELDIRRQAETADLSEGFGARSVLLEKQQELLSGSDNLINEMNRCSESAANGTNQVSASLATVSAQVEIGIERLQRLVTTSRSVTEATAQLKQLAEKTRLQALNISLKIPQVSQALTEAVTPDTEGAYSEFDTYSDSVADDPTGLFDDIHQLTGKLVQISNEADTLIDALQKDIEVTTLALKQSNEEMNASAHHTHAASLLGKELAGYTEQLCNIIDQAEKNIEMQKSELSKTGGQLVRLDKTGNDYSELTLAFTQDFDELQQLSSELADSVSRFKVRGEAPLE